MRKLAPFLGKNRNAISPEDPMRRDQLSISASASLREAPQIKGENWLLNLAVKKSIALTKTGIRLDLIRILL